MVMSKHDINLINQLPNPDLNTDKILNHLNDIEDSTVLKINGFKLTDFTPRNNPDKARLILSVKILSDVYETPIYDLSPNGDIISQYPYSVKPKKLANAKGLNFNLYFYVNIIPFNNNENERAVYLENMNNLRNPEIYNIVNYLIGKSYKHMKNNNKAIHINYKGLKNVLEGKTFTIKVISRISFKSEGYYLNVIGDNDDQD